VIAPIQKHFDERAALDCYILEGTLLPVLALVQRCFDMFAGAQSVDAMVGAVAAVDRLGQ
jgi:hypothetical protein